MPEARPAATIVLLRAGSAGLETLMLKRSGRAGFFPHAWVFPGGRVDAADHQVSTRGAVAGLPAEEAAFAVGAIRECYEEAGIWLGDGQPPAGLRDGLNQRTATLLDAPGLVANLDRLSFIAWWITPLAERRRYDTRFFLGMLAEDEEFTAIPDEHEVVSSIWITPRSAVARHVAGQDFFLAPPTLRVLERLSPCQSLAQVVEAFGTHGHQPIMPRVEMDGEGRVNIILPGHPSLPSDHPVQGATRLVLRDGVWRSHAT